MQVANLPAEVANLQRATQIYLSRNHMTIPMLARKINLSTSLTRNILNYRKPPNLRYLILISNAVNYDPLPLVIAHLKLEIGDELVRQLITCRSPVCPSREESV